MSGHRSSRIPLGSFACAVVSGAILLVAVTATSVTPLVTFTVDSVADAPDAVPGNQICATAAAACTLRAAIEESAAIGVPSEIDVPAGHYLLAAPLELAGAGVTIRGADRATTIIDAAGGGRAFDVLGGAVLGLEKLTVANGSATEEGGAIRAVDSALSFDTVAVSTSATDGYGGGVFASGSYLTITGSLFDHDTGLEGGAVAVMGGDLTITGSTFTGCLAADAGGAIAVFAPHTLSITSSTFTGNTAEHSGGAVFLSGAAGTSAYTIAGSTFTSNQSFGGAGGAIAADGLVSPGTNGALVVDGNTFTGNQADRKGGAIAAASAITSTANTFADNQAPEDPDVATPVPSDLCRDVGVCISAIDSFRCYQAKPAAGAPKFVPLLGVRLADAFGDVMVDLKQRVLLCAPADTTGRVLDTATHLEAYAIKPEKGQAKQVPQTALTLRSEVGTFVVDAAKADQLLLPTAADPATSPNLTVNQVDRFTCHKAKLSKGQPKLAKDVQLTVVDQIMNQPERVLLKKLVRLCGAVGDNGDDTKHADYLLCFQVSATKGRCDLTALVNAGGGCKKETDCGGTKGATVLCKTQAKFARVPGLHVVNDLDEGTLDAAKDGVLCLPAHRLP